MVEPPSVATGDIAFNLIIFFLVCASVQPDSGRKQIIPKSETKEEQTEQSQNVEVSLTRTTATINGDPVRTEQFLPQLRALLRSKTKEEDRVVVVKSRGDVPYHHWITITGWIEQAGGVITLQLEEERTVVAD
jgi:biopolymer transport protein ExbD